MIGILVAAQIAAASSALPATNGATRFELPNGLRVWVQPERSRPIALVQVTYKVGALHDPPGLTGTAHYVEHMVYRATKNVRNEDSYGYIDRIGGRYTGGTWPEMTRYSELVPSWALESALRITAERMTNALFDSVEFERERHNVITEANGYADQDPVSALQDAVMQDAFELHPYRTNSNTWARDNLVITRAQAYEWYKRHYGPNNAVLTVVGDVDVDSVRTLVMKYFAPLQRAPESGNITLVEPPQRVEKRAVLKAPDVAQRLVLAYRAPNAAHRDFPALVVLNRVLRPRLQHAVAQAGLKGDLTTTDSTAQYPYVYRIAFVASEDADLARVLGVIQSGIDDISEKGITAAELATAREPPPPPQREVFTTGAIPPRRSYLSEIADSLTAREAETWEVSPALLARLAAATRRVTSDDIREYAKRWLRTSQRTTGFLVRGENDFEPRWTNDRVLVGERLEIPPLTTPPARRERPAPVPARGLQPLDPVQIPRVRRALANGVIVRAASSGPARDSAAAVIVSFTSAADSAAAARVVTADISLRRMRARVFWRRDTLSGNRPNVIGIAASANVAPLEQLSAAATRVFGAIPAFDHPAATAQRHEPGEERIPKAGEPQVDITVTLPGIPRNHPDRGALELLTYIVGVPWYGGRLGWALTKTGLTYSSAAFTTFGDRDGRITIRTAADTRNTDAVLQAIREVVQGVGEDGVDEWELREAQAFTLGRILLYGAREESDPLVVANALVESELAGTDLLDLPALSRAYLSVTLDDVNRAARRYYRADQLHIVATGAVPPKSQSVFPPGTFRQLFK